MGKIKYLALDRNGNISYCEVPPELRGKVRGCTHIAHQYPNEDPKDFCERIESLRNETIKKREEENKNFEDSFIPFEGTTIKTTPYRMTEEEKKDLIKIENKMQLDQNIDGGYIELDEPLWNDMDKNYFSELSGIKLKNINLVLHEEGLIVKNSEFARYPVGRVIPIEKNEELIDSLKEKGIKFDTGVKAMNNFAKENYDWQATKDVYVLPYYLRIGAGDHIENYDDMTEEEFEELNIISSDITIGYKYLLRQHSNPNKQQLAYEALLDNSSMKESHARYTNGFRKKSLSDKFVGKGGVFRAFLSGNSIPYSGRAVVTPTVDMEYGQIKIPPSMAIDIFKPTLLNQLASEGKNPEQIDKYLSQFRVPQAEVDPEARLDLERRISNKRVAMNRQPSLHTSSFQGFKPLISDNATVQVHPLYCKSYGMDFDGDAVTVYGINSDYIIPTVDKTIGAHNDINTHLPRSRETLAITPEKDSLWGLLNILDKRTDK